MCRSISRLSKTSPDFFEITGSSGTSPETTTEERRGSEKRSRDRVPERRREGRQRREELTRANHGDLELGFPGFASFGARGSGREIGKRERERKVLPSRVYYVGYFYSD